MVNSQIGGFRYISNDNTKILQAHVGGCSFHLLFEPQTIKRRYNTWELLRDETKKIWELYVKFCEPQKISRLAVRYINRFDIPTNTLELEEYFTFFPHVKDIPEMNNIANYGVQTTSVQQDIAGVAVINQTPVQSPIDGLSSILLDIDISMPNLDIDPSHEGYNMGVHREIAST